MMLVTKCQAVLGVAMMVTAAALVWSSGRAATTVTAPPTLRPPVTPPAPGAQHEDQQPRPQSQQDGAEGIIDGHDNNRNGTAGIVNLKFMGRLGNNLFEYATARVLADRLGWALSLQAAPANVKKFGTLLRPQGMKCFPGVRPLGPPASSPAMAQLEAVPFRGFRRELADKTPRAITMMDWYQDFKPLAGDSDRLRQVRGSPRGRLLFQAVQLTLAVCC